MLALIRGYDSGVSRTQSGSIRGFEVDLETFDVEQRQLFAQRIRIDAGRDHRAEYHVAACTRKTVEVESLHSGLLICVKTSPAFPMITSSHTSESGVRSGFTSHRYAPADLAISGSPAAG